MQRAWLGELVAQLQVAAADAVQLVAGLQADPVGQWMPFEDAGVEVQLVAGQLVLRGFTVGVLEPHVELLAAVAFDDHRCRQLFTGKRPVTAQDRKSTRLNSSHVAISYAVVCLKKKTVLLAHLSR